MERREIRVEGTQFYLPDKERCWGGIRRKEKKSCLRGEWKGWKGGGRGLWQYFIFRRWMGSAAENSEIFSVWSPIRYLRTPLACMRLVR
jgi:hypothetical protein